MPTTVWTLEPSDSSEFTSGDVIYRDGTVEDALDTLLPENVIRLSDYMNDADQAAAIAGNTAAQDGSRVTASVQAWLEACLAATLAQDGANIIGFADAGIYRTNNRLMTDAFNNMNWSTGGFSRSRLRLRTDGSVRFRLQNWAGGRAALRTDGPYAGSTYIAPIAVFEWFQATGHQRFGGFEGQWIIEGANNPETDPMGFYLYRLNATTFNGELEVTNLRNRNFVWDSIFNTHADYVRSSGSAGVMLTEAGGSGLLAADTTSTVAGVTRRTGLRYTLSGATITINTMVRNETTGTVESSTPASVFTSDHVGKWIGLDRQGREQLVGDNPDDPAEGGSTRRSVRWFQIDSVTNASTAVLSAAPSQQGTTGQQAQQNRTFSFEVLKCSVTAGSNIATLSMPVTMNLVGFEVVIPGAHYDGLPARRPHLCAMVTAHSGNTVTLSHAAGVTRSGVPFVVAPQVTIGSLSHTEFLSSSRNCDDFHIARVWCESGQTAAVPLFIQDATNVTIGDESKLHGCPSTNNVNFGANFTCVLAGDFGVRFKGRFTHSRHSREFGMFYLGGDRSEAWIDGELSSWTADDQTAIFYIDPANVASTRIWDVYFNASDYATGFPDASAGQVFERGGPNYTPGRVKAGASQRSPRGERPLWPPVTLPPSRAPWWGSTRADAVSALARGGVVPENGVIYTIGGLEYLGQTGATAIADLPGLTWAGERDIRHFGAESGAADVRAAFVAARDSVPAGQAGKVIVPPGVWNISTSLTANNNNFVEWEIQDGASVLPSVSARISGTTRRINHPRSGDSQYLEVRNTPTVANGNTLVEYHQAWNTGGQDQTGYARRLGYNSTAFGIDRFDIADGVVAQFDRSPGQRGGTGFAQWLVAISPTTGDGLTLNDSWRCNVTEMNILNRGPDTGFSARRSDLLNHTGIMQLVIEDDLFVDPATTKNATFAIAFAGQTPTGLDVDRRRFYAGLLGEPNCIAGLTGRAIYWTGDTTGQADRIPLATVEAAGRWGYGLKLNDGTFDTAAIAVPNGSKIAWQSTVEAESGSILITENGSIAMGNAAPAPGSTINRIYEGSGSGVFSRSRNILRRVLSSPSNVALTTDGSAANDNNTLNIPDTSSAMFEGTVVAANTTGACAMWTVRGIVDRRSGAATTTVKGLSVTNVHADAGAATWTISVTADTTRGGISVTASGTGGFNALADLTLTLIDFA